LGRVTSEGSRNNVSINLTSPRSLPTSLCCLPLLPEREVTSPSNYSLVFVIFIIFFGQLKDWVGQVLFLVSGPKGQVEKYVNVEAWLGFFTHSCTHIHCNCKIKDHSQTEWFIQTQFFLVCQIVFQIEKWKKQSDEGWGKANINLRIDNNFCYFLKYLCSPEKGWFSCVGLKRPVFVNVVTAVWCQWSLPGILLAESFLQSTWAICVWIFQGKLVSILVVDSRFCLFNLVTWLNICIEKTKQT
jgi:hypothetical protein